MIRYKKISQHLHGAGGPEICNQTLPKHDHDLMRNCHNFSNLDIIGTGRCHYLQAVLGFSSYLVTIIVLRFTSLIDMKTIIQCHIVYCIEYSTHYIDQRIICICV